MRIFYTILRISLGLLFIFSGYVKVVDPWGSAIKMGEYFEAMNLGILQFMSFPLANLFSILELLTGYLLLFNIQRKWATRMAFLFMLFFTPLTFWSAVTEKVTDCGCFGDAVKLTQWETFYKNIVLFAIALFVVIVSHKYPARFNLKKQRLLFILGLIFSTGVVFYSYQHLPLIDFRPFKVGNDIQKGIEIPENAPIDQYETTLKYEKNGVTKEFTEDNYPWQDSTWNFVSSEQRLIKKGYEPPIHDFYIETINGENITQRILDDETALLIISYKIEETNLVKYFQENLKHLVKKANEQQIPVYLLTSSNVQQIENIEGYIQGEISYCFADEKMLKTAIRANPGVMLLRQGVVAKKWNANDLTKNISLESNITTKNALIEKDSYYKKQLYLSLLILAILAVITLVIIKLERPKTKKK